MADCEFYEDWRTANMNECQHYQVGVCRSDKQAAATGQYSCPTDGKERMGMMNLDKKLTEMSARLALAETDAFVLAARLMAEDADTFGPECYKAMKRWAPKVMEAIGEVRDVAA